MKHFLVLFLAPISEREEMMKNMSHDEMLQIVGSWRKWKQENASSLVDAGNPVGKTKCSNLDGISDLKNEIDSYVIVRATTHDEAMRLFGTDHPHFSSSGARVEVMEIVTPPRDRLAGERARFQ